MTFDDVVKARRSIRNYKPDTVPDHDIQALLEAARLAPSGLNTQPWRFVVVKDAGMRARLAEATPSRFIADAPAVIICCVDPEAFASTGDRLRELQSAGAVDAAVSFRYGSGEFTKELEASWVSAQLSMYSAIAATHILLKAVDLGLGCCWIGLFDAEHVKAIAGIDKKYGILALLPTGYAAQQPAPRPRLPVDDLLLNTVG